jgi:TetR/AcrR family transcriptional repressor of bet genes
MQKCGTRHTLRSELREFQPGNRNMADAALQSGRTASKEARRQQLIEATIKCIGKLGISSTTLSKVANEAGLSQGIVNLHFRSKDNLLSETLRYLADEYKALFEKTLEKSGPGAADTLLGLLELDLRPSVCNPRKLAVWFAFWGEAKAVPTYQKICDAYDQEYDDVIQALCEQIIEEGGYKDVDARIVTEALCSMTDGLWQSCLVSPKSWDRGLARDAVYSYLRAIFPKHYD